jgi:hypothetical protein
MRASRRTRPEPNFGRLVTERDLPSIEITAHALRRFVQRLEPGIPGAAAVADAMARLEALKGARSGAQQAQLNQYRDWMTKHVEPFVIDAILCEGFWATERPCWSRSRTPSDGYLQVGGLCGFPVIRDGRRAVLTTCTNGNDIVWDVSLTRGYTLMSKPYLPSEPPLARRQSWIALLGRSWRSRVEHGGLLAAFRSERARAIQTTRRQNTQQQTAAHATAPQWPAQLDRAHQAFRNRHSAV